MSISFGLNRAYFLSLFTAVVFLAAPTMSAAQARFTTCDGCLQNQSVGAATSLTQNGRVYVMDRVNDTIKAYDVVTYTDFDPPSTTAWDASTPVHMSNYFGTIVAQLHVAVDSGVSIPANVAASAHGLVGNNQAQVEVGAFLRDVFFAKPEIPGTPPIPDSDLENIRERILEGQKVEADFSDGSKARFEFEDLAVGEDVFELVDDSLAGPQDNAIPDHPSDVTPGTTGSFSGVGVGGLGARDSFIQTLDLLGISLSGNGLTGGGGACSTFVCSASQGGVECEFSFSGC